MTFQHRRAALFGQFLRTHGRRGLLIRKALAHVLISVHLFAGANQALGEPVVSGSVVAYSHWIPSRTAYATDGYWSVADMAVDAAGNVYVTGSSCSSFESGVCDVFVRKLNSKGAVVYSIRIGGSDDDAGMGIAVDIAGNVYVTGYTLSNDFPIAGPIQADFAGGNCGIGSTTRPCSDAFLVKLNPTGSEILYATYFGGGAADIGEAVTVDTAGNAYVTGRTRSGDFPIANAFQASLGQGICGTPAGTFPCDDAFVTKVNSTGSALVYSTYLGGGRNDWGVDIAVSADGRVSVAGSTSSSDFPSVNAIQSNFSGGCDTEPCLDVFVTRLNTTGSELVYSTYLGGSGNDYASSIAVDAEGRVYVAGITHSADFPTLRPLQAEFGGGKCGTTSGTPHCSDAFVSKIDASGSELVYATFLGGARNSSYGTDIAVDSSGHAYVAGVTGLWNFPAANPLHAERIGVDDPFVVRLDPTGSAFHFSAYLDHGCFALEPPVPYWTCVDGLNSIGVDDAGNIYVAGTTVIHPGGYPLVAEFVAKIDPAGKPEIAANGIVNASTYQPGPIAPGETIAIFGYGIGTFAAGRVRSDSDRLRETSLRATRVLFDGVEAQLLYVSSNQVNAIVPDAVAGKRSIQVQIEFAGIKSEPVTVLSR